MQCVYNFVTSLYDKMQYNPHTCQCLSLLHSFKKYSKTLMTVFLLTFLITEAKYPPPKVKGDKVYLDHSV